MTEGILPFLMTQKTVSGPAQLIKSIFSQRRNFCSSLATHLTTVWSVCPFVAFTAAPSFFILSLSFLL